MSAPELRPAALTALRWRRWRAIGWLAFGTVLTIGTLAIYAATSNDPGDDAERRLQGRGLILGLAAGIGAVASGLAIVSENRTLRGAGRRVELVPIFGPGLERRSLLDLTAEDRIVERAWLVGPGTDAWRLAVPVDPALARRAEAGTAATVRGRFEPGGRVVLDFPQEVAFPIGPVLPVRPGPPERMVSDAVTALHPPMPWSAIGCFGLAAALFSLALSLPFWTDTTVAVPLGAAALLAAGALVLTARVARRAAHLATLQAQR